MKTLRRKGKRTMILESLRFSRVMEPTGTGVSLIREGRGTINEKITPNDSLRKLENTRTNNCAESDAESRLKSLELIDRDLYCVKDEEEDRISCMGMGSWRKQTEGGRRLVNNLGETPLSQAGASASSMGDVTRQTVTGDKETA